jgi:YD repeat-containing protein
LNRLTSKNYSNGDGQVLYGYDLATVHFVPVPANPARNLTTRLANPIGRLSYVSHVAAAGYGVLDTYSYDAMGRVQQEWTSTPSYNLSGAPVYTRQAVYDLAGNITQLTYSDGRVINQTWDGAGHLATVASSSGYQYMTLATYFPDGSYQTMWRGNGVANGSVRNNRMQVWARNTVRMGANAPGNYSSNQGYELKEFCYGPAVASPSPSAIGPCPSFNSANNGNIRQIIDGPVSGRTQTFAYDSLNRLNSFSQADSSIAQTYAIDPFGNLNQVGPTLSSGLAFDSYNRSSGYRIRARFGR